MPSHIKKREANKLVIEEITRVKLTEPLFQLVVSCQCSALPGPLHQHRHHVQNAVDDKTLESIDKIETVYPLPGSTREPRTKRWQVRRFLLAASSDDEEMQNIVTFYDSLNTCCPCKPCKPTFLYYYKIMKHISRVRTTTRKAAIAKYIREQILKKKADAKKKETQPKINVCTDVTQPIEVIDITGDESGEENGNEPATKMKLSE